MCALYFHECCDNETTLPKRMQISLTLATCVPCRSCRSIEDMCVVNSEKSWEYLFDYIWCSYTPLRDSSLKSSTCRVTGELDLTTASMAGSTTIILVSGLLKQQAIVDQGALHFCYLLSISRLCQQVSLHLLFTKQLLQFVGGPMPLFSQDILMFALKIPHFWKPWSPGKPEITHSKFQIPEIL